MIASDELLSRIAEVLKAMADPTRLKILHSLHNGERCVSDILEMSAEARPMSPNTFRCSSAPVSSTAAAKGSTSTTGSSTRASSPSAGTSATRSSLRIDREHQTILQGRIEIENAASKNDDRSDPRTPTMPIYEYRCTACGTVFARLQSISTPAESIELSRLREQQRPNASFRPLRPARRTGDSASCGAAPSCGAGGGG